MPEYHKMCMDCGEILSGPGKGEHNPDFRHTDVYKGIPHSSSLCKDCERGRQVEQVARRLYKKRLGP